MLTVKIIAARLCVSQGVIQREIRQGKLRALRVGGVYRVKEEWFEEYFERAEALAKTGQEADPWEGWENPYFAEPAKPAGRPTGRAPAPQPGGESPDAPTDENILDRPSGYPSGPQAS